MGEDMVENMVEEKKGFDALFTRKRKTVDKEKKPPSPEVEEVEDVKKPKRERKPPEGEPDYEWCRYSVLPKIEVTFENRIIVSERTNYKIMR